MSSELLRCDACHQEHGPCQAHRLGDECPSCPLGFLRLASGEAGGTPSEGHAGLPNAGVPLESGSDNLGPNRPAGATAFAEGDVLAVIEGPTDDELIDDEIPVSMWVAARRWTRKYKKFIKGYAGQIFHAPCSRCRLDCVIAKSTHLEIEAAWERGERWEVLCDVCKEVVAPNAPEGMTEAQSQELLRNAMIADSQVRRN